MATVLGSKQRRLNLRTTRQQHEFIKNAAKLSGQNLTDFVLSSACSRAEQVLAERRHFALSTARWKLFLSALDRPSKPAARLVRLMEEPSLLDR